MNKVSKQLADFYRKQKKQASRAERREFERQTMKDIRRGKFPTVGTPATANNVKIPIEDTDSTYEPAMKLLLEDQQNEE